jgi:hypothetical protein
MVPDSRRRLRTPTSNTAAHPLYAVRPGCLFVAAAWDGVTFLNIAHPPVDLLLTLLYRIFFNEPRFSLYCCCPLACSPRRVRANELHHLVRHAGTTPSLRNTAPPRSIHSHTTLSLAVRYDGPHSGAGLSRPSTGRARCSVIYEICPARKDC